VFQLHDPNSIFSGIILPNSTGEEPVYFILKNPEDAKQLSAIVDNTTVKEAPLAMPLPGMQKVVSAFVRHDLLLGLLDNLKSKGFLRAEDTVHLAPFFQVLASNRIEEMYKAVPAI